MVAQSTAELEMQDARIEQVRLQLQADLVEPAEARRRKAEEDAKADAAKLVEQGKATAAVLQEIADAYQGSGASGRDVLLMQKLLPLLDKLSGTMGALHVNRLAVLGTSAGGDSGGDLAHKIVSYSEQIKAATGVDVTRVVQARLGAPEPTGPAQ